MDVSLESAVSFLHIELRNKILELAETPEFFGTVRGEINFQAGKVSLVRVACEHTYSPQKKDGKPVDSDSQRRNI